MTFGMPYALWGLLGLSIPILIHLLSKKERHVVYYGSIHFLKSDHAQSAKSFNLARYLLLLTRLLFISLICLIMAQPNFENGQLSKTYWVEEGLDLEKIVALENNNVSADELLTYHIGEEAGRTPNSFPSIWTLIDYLNHQKDSSVVYGTATIKQMNGKPVPLAGHVAYALIPKPENTSARQISRNGKELTEWSIYSDHNKTLVKTYPYSGVANTSETLPLRMGVLHSFDTTYLPQLRSFLGFIEEYLPYDIDWQANGQDADWHIVVDTTTFVKDSAFIWIPGEQALKVLQFSPSRIVFSGRLDRESILQSDLPVLIMSLLNRNYTNIDHYDDRVYYEQMMNQSGKMEHVRKRRNQVTYSALSPLWWFIILPVLGLERYLSHRKI